MQAASWQGVERLALICNSVPCMGSILTSAAAERHRAPLFCDDGYLKAMCDASVNRRGDVPGGLHFLAMERFLIGHSYIDHEHQYLEFLSNGCRERVDYECSREDHRAGRMILLENSSWVTFTR